MSAERDRVWSAELVEKAAEAIRVADDELYDPLADNDPGEWREVFARAVLGAVIDSGAVIRKPWTRREPLGAMYVPEYLPGEDE